MEILQKITYKSLLNPLIKSKIKLLGDSITAGLGGTGYNACGEEIGKTGFQVNEGGYCWGNEFKRFLENSVGGVTYVEPFHPSIHYHVPYQREINQIYELGGCATLNGNQDGDLLSFSFYGSELILYLGARCDGGTIDIVIEGSSHQQICTYNHNEERLEVKITGLQNVAHTCTLKGIEQQTTNEGYTIHFQGIRCYNSIAVKNWGVSGKDSFWLWENRATLIEEDDDILLVTMGVNDRIGNTSWQETKTYLREFHHYAVSKGKMVIFGVANVLSARHEYGETHYMFTQSEVARAIRELGYELNVPVIDAYSETLKYLEQQKQEPNEILKDDIHPNDEGYKLLFQIITRAFGIPVPLKY